MAMKNVKRIIVRVSDGLGNQLFEYALGKYLSDMQTPHHSQEYILLRIERSWTQFALRQAECSAKVG